jgi:hypothetical protein
MLVLYGKIKRNAQALSNLYENLISVVPVRFPLDLFIPRGFNAIKF